MLAVKASPPSVQSASGGATYEIACINGTDQTVLSGTSEEIDFLSESVRRAGLSCTKLDVPYAFHSSQVDPILEEFENYASAAIFNAPKVPVLSPLLSKVISKGGTFDSNYLCRHARQPVNFLGALKAGELDQVINGRSIWIEIGPHPVCYKMIKSTLTSVNVGVPSLRKDEDPWRTLARSLRDSYCAGLSLDWGEVHKEFDESHRLLDIPSYGFDYQEYWIEYVGDWCPTKGQPASITSAEIAALPPKPQLSTDSVHCVVEEDIKGTTGRVVTQSDISKPIIHEVITGHLVNDNALCPSVSFMGSYIGDICLQPSSRYIRIWH